MPSRCTSARETIVVNSPLSNSESVEQSEPNESWRSEVASRLDSYRARRKRNLAGQFSMRFDEDGEPAPPRAALRQAAEARTPATVAPDEHPIHEEAAQALPATVPESVVVAEVAAEPTVASETLQEKVPVENLQPERPIAPFRRKIVMGPNVIEFPRLFAAEPGDGVALAEPVHPSAPRILDAPEIAAPLIDTPLLDGLRLESTVEEQTHQRLEVPLGVAFLAPRVYAGVIDLVTVLAGGILALVLAHSMAGPVEWSKSLVGALLGMQFVFWALYQYLFLVYGGRTPGMQVSRVSLKTFAGRVPTRRERRRRVLGLLLSCMSLSLGFLWAFFDEDALCWHDRISGTYSTQES